MSAPEISFAIPCHNEEDNLRALVTAVTGEAARLGLDHEIVITDDCSTDGSWELLKALVREFPRLRAQRLEQQSGQSAASFASIRAARGRIVVTLDADLQNDPVDLSKLLVALEHADCVCGARGASRAQSDSWMKNVVSRASNWVRSRVLRDPITDAGCGFRAMRRECLEEIPFFRGVHRFLPVLLDMQGFRVTEVPVTNRARRGGTTHYGLFTRAGAIIDMFAVRWMKSRMRRFQVAERFPD
jgi:glycosyltransferase involved in cell wall biosynthesis